MSRIRMMAASKIPGHRLLTTKPEILECLRERIDCLVIDEFQDTNPLQFSLLWALKGIGIPTLIVGDVKQAIMGFQNADHRLLQALQEKHPSSVSPLGKNWRSTPAIMVWINAAGSKLFGDGYTPLEPMAQYPSSLIPIEVLLFDKRPDHGKKIIPAQHLALRLRELLADGSQEVYDRHSGMRRRLRGGDIAILCPTHSYMGRYQEALSSLGIRSRMQQDGWLNSRIVQIACHALSYTTDPSDLHAALYLAVTELGSLSLESALKTMLADCELADPVLDALAPLAGKAGDRTVDEILDTIIAALDLFGRISTWPDAAQARANLLRLQGEAWEFMHANFEALASGGYYGTGVKTFLAWLNARSEQDNSQPEPRVIDEDAVTITTWHRAKGREWPIVAVCGMDHDVSPKLPDARIVYNRFDDLSAILENAFIEIYPSFDADEIKDIFQGALTGDALDNAARLLYVAITRAREKIILECPLYLDGTRDSYWNVFLAKTGIGIGENEIKMDGSCFSCLTIRCSHTSPPEFEEDNAEETTQLPTSGRRTLKPRPVPDKLTPEAIAPSRLHGTNGDKRAPLKRIPYSSPIIVGTGSTGVERGIFLHKCFEVGILSHGRLSGVFSSFGIEIDDAGREQISSSITAFKSCLESWISPTGLFVEVPVLGLDGNGSVVTGTVDLIAETRDGLWIIDHKSDQSGDLEELFQHYLPQLECYAGIISRAMPGKPLSGLAINWISHGELMLTASPF